MIKITVRTQFEKQKLKKKAETATFTSLSEAGGAVRKDGQAEHSETQEGIEAWKPTEYTDRHAQASDSLRRHQQPNVVAIGPVNEIAGRIWNLHEFGGVRPSVASSSLIDSRLASMVPSVPYNTEARPSSRGSNCEPELRRIERHA